jgi:hypothetical protein
MSDTRNDIVKLSERLLRLNGYNAFSYVDISKPLSIKNAAVHYYFPRKADLAIGIIEDTMSRMRDIQASSVHKLPIDKLKAFLKVYTEAGKEGKMCLVTALTSEIHSLDETVQVRLKDMVQQILRWLTEILKEGREQGVFYFEETARTKALLIISNMIGGLLLSRVTGVADYSTIYNNIIKNIRQHE